MLDIVLAELDGERLLVDGAIEPRTKRLVDVDGALDLEHTDDL